MFAVMNRRRWMAALLAAILLCGRTRAESPEMRIDISGNEVLPGSAVIVTMSVPNSGVCSIRILDAAGGTVSVVTIDRPVTEGYNAMYWNGTWEGVACPAGQWRMVLEMNGYTAETPVTVGRMIPCLISPDLSVTETPVGRNVTALFCATEAGRVTISLRMSGTEAAAYSAETAAGDGTLVFPASVPPGKYETILTLTRADGTSSVPVSLPLTVREPAISFSAVYTSPQAGQDLTLNGWTVPMDITDEEAVWQALTSPVTVVDDGKSSDQRRQMIVREEPSENSRGNGMVTMISQGVHVLERGDEWSRIECYSSSFYNSEILNWNVLIQGYVPTRVLKEVTPSQEMGMVIDKLTQRMYIFRDGRLFSTLLVSTGLMNERQPYNETRSGEFLLVSKVGGFYSDNYYCPLAIRFNAGDMLHEVPYIARNNDYSGTEPRLGSKYSHGCVRVQRKANPEGVNMQWIWKHYQQNTKILIWEDWQGRQIPIPDDDTVFYSNTRKNNYYHSSKNCSELGTHHPNSITYGELSGDAGKKLKACPYCGPSPKRDELEEINAIYAEGGDHEPEMTKAREACPRKLKER